MKTFSTRLSIAALCAVATPALADISAAELWADWQANAPYIGGEMIADVETSGDGLILRNFAITTIMDEATSVAALDEIRLVENGDGSVSVIPSQPYRIRTEIVENGQNLGSMEFLVTYENPSIVATGAANDITYTFGADSVSLSEGEMAITAVEFPDMDIMMTMEDVASIYSLSGPLASRTFTSSGSVANTVFELDVTEPSDGVQTKLSGALGAMQFDGGGAFSAIQAYMQAFGTSAAGAVPNDPAGAGAGFDGTFEYASMNYDMRVTEPTGQVQITGANGGGAAMFGFSENALTYDLSARDTQLSVAGSEIPFPVQMTMAASGFGVTLPVVAQEEPSDFALSMNVTDLEINDQLWAMFDPGQAIPRDPATVSVDLSGTAQMFMDLFAMDPAAMTGPPGELRSLTLNELLVSAAGAVLTGDGAVEFAPGAFPPMPVGEVNLTLAGLNGLLEALTAAGFVPAEQAGMARAMVGMFARPGAEPDTLESTIEFTPGGGISANGMPLR